MIFEGYLSLMNALHVNWLLRRRQFSLILDSTAAVRRVLPTCIMLALPFFILLLIVSVYWTSCVDVWQNMSPGDGGSPHSSLGDPIMRLHKAYFTFTNTFWYPLPGGLLAYFSCFIFLNASTSYLSFI